MPNASTCNHLHGFEFFIQQCDAIGIMQQFVTDPFCYQGAQLLADGDSDDSDGCQTMMILMAVKP